MLMALKYIPFPMLLVISKLKFKSKRIALVFQKNGYETFTVRIADVISKKVKVVPLRI